MIILRKSSERGHSQNDWLNSLHTFSFANYQDANFMGFGNLRVINQDTVQANQGFGKHAHHNMEIISFVIDGALEHKDSLGTGSIIKPGEIQRMSAGTGVSHSEYNHSQTLPLHFLQIWIIPSEQGLPPSYEQKTITKINNELILIGAAEGGKQAVVIHQDVKLFVAYLMKDHTIQYLFNQDRKGWLQVIKGAIKVNDLHLTAGDGAAITNVNKIEIYGLEQAEFLLFDLN